MCLVASLLLLGSHQFAFLIDRAPPLCLGPKMSKKPNPELGFRDMDKPDFRELDLGSSLLPSTSCSSSSSGSVSGRNGRTRAGTMSDPGPYNLSGELSGSSESSPKSARKAGHSRSDSAVLTGNIFPPGRVLKTGMATSRSPRSDVLGSGMGHYGHGSIVRGTTALPKSAAGDSNSLKRAMLSVDPEEVKRAGNDHYRRGLFEEALSLYDRAIALSPGNAAFRSNRAAALTGLRRLVEAVKECQEAVRLDPGYGRAHQRLASLLLRLGQVENARKHLRFLGQQPDPAELRKLQAVEKHLSKCSDARRIGDWKSALRECDAAIVAGADSSLQLFMCRAEALLKLHQLEDAEAILAKTPRVEPHISSSSHTRFFGMLAEAYPLFVRSQIEMALGRFENAVAAAEKAGQMDPRNADIAAMLTNVRLVARARSRGNDLFKSERFTEACSAYGEGLKLAPSNSVLYCNRAACWYKLGLWERSVDDCNQALRIQPNYTKALLRRAACNTKMEKWVDAVRDYEILRWELPNDNEVAESLFHAQVALKKSRGEEVHNMRFGGEVVKVSGLEQFRAAISYPGVSAVHFQAPSNTQCKQISPFVDTLCSRYPFINFLKVDVVECRAVANAENIRIVPTFKIYKNGSAVKEIISPSPDTLEYSVRHYSF